MAEQPSSSDDPPLDRLATLAGRAADGPAAAPDPADRLVVSARLCAGRPVDEPVHARDASASGAGGAPRSDADPEGLARRRARPTARSSRPSSPRWRPTSGTRWRNASRSSRQSRRPPSRSPRRRRPTTAAVAGRPMGAEGPRHAAGLLAARPGHAGQHRRRRPVRKMRRQGRPDLLRRQRRRRAAQTTAVCPATGTIPAPRRSRPGSATTARSARRSPPCSATPGQTGWTGPPNSLTCRRVSDTLAICRDRLNFEHEFRRE